MSAFFGMIIAVVKMKIVVVSDSHGRDDALEYVLQQHGDAYAYIHCGDIDADPGAFPRFVTVGGNNDIFYDYPDEQILSIGTHRIFIVHSHQFMFESCWQQFIEVAYYISDFLYGFRIVAPKHLLFNGNILIFGLSFNKA